MLSFCSFSCGLCACDKVDVCLALDMSGSVCSMAPAAIDVDASLDGVRRSTVTVVRIGPPGVSNGLTSDCPAGKSSQSGAFECTDCLKGTYTAEAGQDTCQPCLPFSTTTTTGEPGCFACLQGNYWIPSEAVWKSNSGAPRITD